MLYFHPMPTCHFLKKRLSRHYNMYSCTLDFFPLFEIAQVHFHKKPITNSFTDAYFSALLTEFNFFKYFFFYYQANYFLFSFFYYLVFLSTHKAAPHSRENYPCSVFATIFSAWECHRHWYTTRSMTTIVWYSFRGVQKGGYITIFQCYTTEMYTDIYLYNLSASLSFSGGKIHPIENFCSYKLLLPEIMDSTTLDCRYHVILF